MLQYFLNYISIFPSLYLDSNNDLAQIADVSTIIITWYDALKKLDLQILLPPLSPSVSRNTDLCNILPIKVKPILGKHWILDTSCL